MRRIQQLGSIRNTATAFNRYAFFGALALGLAACDAGSALNPGRQKAAYTVIPWADANGSISPDTGRMVAPGETATFTVTPDANYTIEQVSGTCGGTLKGDTYTTEVVTADCTVTASFTLARHDVTPVAANGSISPADVQSIVHGKTITFKLTPDSKYRIGKVTGCDGELDGDVYTTGPVTANCTVTAEFPPIPPQASALDMTHATTKAFNFSWLAVTRATEYRLLESEDGIAGYTQVASFAEGVTSHSMQVLLPARINARYILQACNSGGCTDSDPVEVSDTVVEAAGQIKGYNTYEGHEFGRSLALSGDGNTLAVGAPAEQGDFSGICVPGDIVCEDELNVKLAFSHDKAGAVYVFSRNGATWVPQAYIKDNIDEDEFGISVALSYDGNTLAVGSWIDENWLYSGEVQVFTRSETTWSMQARLRAPNNATFDYFSTSLALSADGNTLAVGAPGEDSNATGVCASEEAGCDTKQANNSASDSGAVYIFARSSTTWSLQAYVKASNTGASDAFGTKVALSSDGQTLAVSALGEDSNATGSCAPEETGCDTSQADDSSSGSGAVYVFVRNGTAWSQQAYVKATNTGSSDAFGFSVALSSDGQTLAIGAPEEDGNATEACAVEEATCISKQATNSLTNSGAVYVFTRSGTAWTPQAYVKQKKSDWGSNYPFFGTSVALSADGNTVVGGPRQNVGGTYNEVDGFVRKGTTWSYRFTARSIGIATKEFGWAIALSADGQTLAVGGPRDHRNVEDSWFSPDAGIVYIY